MKFLHTGRFLAEGLAAAGHEARALRLAEGEPLGRAVAASGFGADAVLVVLFGGAPLPAQAADCELPLVAYCVDTPLNEFWLKHYLRLFDYVFVDQAASVRALEAVGIRAAWLPLFASERDFRPGAPKEHLVSFVGRASPHRVKRANILKAVAAAFPLNHVQGVSREAMQDVFVRSSIVLNENLFPGPNLRSFLALASGSVLLAEEDLCGLGEFFEPGRDFAAYTPDNLLATIAGVRDDPEGWRRRALAARQKCFDAHRAVHRAVALVDALDGAAGRNGRPDVEERRQHEAYAHVLRGMRFGGDVTGHVRLLREMAARPDADHPLARYALGRVHAQRGRMDRAAEHLGPLAERAGRTGLLAAVKLALVSAHSGDRARAEAGLREVVERFLRAFPDERDPGPLVRPDDARATLHDLYLFFARVLCRMGMPMEVGFHKQEEERFPDTALECAQRAWDIRPSAVALRIMLDAAQEAGVKPEILPYVREWILMGQATCGQTAEAVEMARAYYDYDLARVMSRSLADRLRADARKGVRRP